MFSSSQTLRAARTGFVDRLLLRLRWCSYGIAVLNVSLLAQATCEARLALCLAKSTQKKRRQSAMEEYHTSGLNATSPSIRGMMPSVQRRAS